MEALLNTSMNASITPILESHGEGKTPMQARLLLAVKIINYASITLTMFGMGCAISIKDFSRKELHLPQSVVIGLGMQYFIQPLVGYILATVLDMSTYEALAMIILASCPVSPYCAVLVYFGEGYVIVGLCLSMFSTALAIGMLPFWFSFYAGNWTEEFYVIGTPYDIALTEALIFVPTAAGCMFKKYAGAKRARIVGKACSMVFILAAVISPALNAIEHPQHYQGSWHLWVGGILLPLIGFICGFFMSFLFQLPYESCSAVSLAVGTSNWYLATALAWRFFSANEAELHEVLTLVSIFGISMPVEGFLWSVMYRAIEEFFMKIYPQCCKPLDEDEDGGDFGKSKAIKPGKDDDDDDDGDDD